MLALRRAGAGGTLGQPAIVGGLVAGALLGPTLLGRVAPNAHEDLFVGARMAREQWSAAVVVHEAQAAAELAARVDRVDAAPSQAVQAAEAEWRSAAWQERRPQRIAAAGLAALVLLVAGGLRPAPARLPERVQRIDAVLIGLWSGAFPALGATLAMWLLGEPLLDSGAVWALAALAIGPWALDRIDCAIAEESEEGGLELILRAATAATALAVLLLLLAVARRTWSLPASTDTLLVAHMAPTALALLAGALVLAIVAGRQLARRSSSATATRCPPGDNPTTTPPLLASRASLAAWALAPLCALAMVRIELFRDAAPWLIVALAVLGGDGRVAGAFLGAVLAGGRRPLRALRLSLVAGAAAPTQLALAAPAVCAEVVSPRLGMALLASAAFVELTGTVRARVAASIRELDANSTDTP